MTDKDTAASIKKEVSEDPQPSADGKSPAAKENGKVLAPTDRDVVVDEDGGAQHKCNMLLKDMIRLHYLLLAKEKSIPSEAKDVKDLAKRLTTLMLKGKSYELAGLKDVPRPFLKGEGQFFGKKDGTWSVVGEQEATAFVTKTILSEFKGLKDAKLEEDTELKGNASILLENPASGDGTKADGTNDAVPHSAPRPFDVLFLPIDFPVDESMPLYEHQSGNKHTLFLASQHVSSDTNDCPKRVAAALKLVTTKMEINNGTEIVQRYPRHVIQRLVDNQNSWQEMERVDLGEFAIMFVFEVYLEKQIHGSNLPGGGAASAKAANIDQPEEPQVPVDTPTSHDVLFGRGGMTNGHPGNRRFRDIIALHRPDYIRASKMDKPNVARRIVRAIRQGIPMGRFLKKGESGKWFDVGDRCAAEKTSQGLRERSNAEKRQRSALREALKIRKEDLADAPAGESASKKQKLISTPAGMGGLGIVPGYLGVATPAINYAGAIPLSLSMKEKPKESKAKKAKKSVDGKEVGDTDSARESLPPNAVDNDGNILVTDYDILCGRGGLTNHHPGNKRFRDIVALHRPDYVRAPKIQKPSVARVIVRAIRHGDPPGRFIKKDEKTGKWYDIGDKRAAEKTSQALREKTNEERDRPKNPPGFTSPTVFLPSPTSAALAASASAMIQAATSGTTASKAESSAAGETKQVAAKADDAGAKDKGKAAKASTDKKGDVKKQDGEEKKTEDKKAAVEV